MSCTITMILAVWMSVLPSGGTATQRDQRPWYQFKGAQIPKYFIVQESYSRSFRDRNSTDFLKRIRQWGVQPDSHAEEILFESIKEANWIVTEMLDMRPYVKDPVLFEEVQDAFQRKKVHALRNLHRKTLAGLASAGVDVLAVEEYIETLRDSMSIGSSDPILDSKGIWAEFEADDPENASGSALP